MKKRFQLTMASAAAAVVAFVAVGDVSADHRHRGHDGGKYSRHGGHGHGGWGRHHRRHGMHKRARQLLKRYDENKDGQITQEEIDTNRQSWHKTHDADGDGALSIAEFEKLWLQAMRHRMVRAFQRLDEDGDSAITLEEYTEPMADFVERLDRDGDGALSRMDRRGRHGRMDRNGRHGGMHGRDQQREQDSDSDEN